MSAARPPSFRQPTQSADLIETFVAREGSIQAVLTGYEISTVGECMRADLSAHSERHSRGVPRRRADPDAGDGAARVPRLGTRSPQGHFTGEYPSRCAPPRLWSGAQLSGRASRTDRP
jgi:hypothetical protein